MVMPGMSGREVAEKLRSMSPTLRVIYASGYAADANPESGDLPRMDRYLEKPFTMTDLAEALHGNPAS
jgi:CheY-like chemotaxis protein